MKISCSDGTSTEFINKSNQDYYVNSLRIKNKGKKTTVEITTDSNDSVNLNDLITWVLRQNLPNLQASIASNYYLTNPHKASELFDQMLHRMNRSEEDRMHEKHEASRAVRGVLGRMTLRQRNKIREEEAKWEGRMHPIIKDECRTSTEILSEALKDFNDKENHK